MYEIRMAEFETEPEYCSHCGSKLTWNGHCKACEEDFKYYYKDLDDEFYDGCDCPDCYR